MIRNDPKEIRADGSRTPLIIRFAVALTFFNTWVLFEETVIDRYGLWEFLPYYRYGKLCAWDVGAILLIGWFTYRVFARRCARSGNSA